MNLFNKLFKKNKIDYEARIIKYLEDDSLTPSQVISKDLNISIEEVNRIIKRLDSSGKIKYKEVVSKGSSGNKLFKCIGIDYVYIDNEMKFENEIEKQSYIEKVKNFIQLHKLEEPHGLVETRSPFINEWQQEEPIRDIEYVCLFDNNYPVTRRRK